MVNNSTSEDSQRLYLNDEDCDSIFQIPFHLVESYGDNLPSKASLKVDGKKWKVSVEKFKDNYFFTNGWKEFAEEVDLKSLNWLKFKSASSSSKQKGTNNEETRETSGDANGTKSSIPDENNKDMSSRVVTELSFTRKIKKYQRHRLDIPKFFVLGSGMHKGENIKIKDSEGREWPVHVTERARVFSMCGGWSDFAIENKVMVGSKISFTWLSENMLQAQIVEVGTDKQPLFTTKRISRWKRDDEVNETSSLPNEDKGEGSGAKEKLSFCKELKKHHRYCLDIPKIFAMSIGIHKDEEIKLKNGEGREWSVHLTVRGRRIFTICGGWSDFVKGNNLMLGSTISFTWLSGNMLQTEISEVGTDRQPLLTTNRRWKRL